MIQKVGYQAVFYSGDKRIEVSQVRETYEEAKKEIDKLNETFSIYKYNPWTLAEVEEVMLKE